ncbi:hypothetical protein CR513_32229, partial [Mucuna pruriens]
STHWCIKKRALLGLLVNCPLHLYSTNLYFLNVILYNFQHFLESKDDTHLDTSLLKVLAIKNWHVGRKSSIRTNHDSRIFSFPNRSIKILRTDDGGEYTSHDFHSYCDKEGIIHEVTAPYTPQHNEKVERKNRTLMNMTQCILIGQMRPKKYLPET